MRRAGIAVALLLAWALLPSGCGSSGEDEAPTPTLARALANDLASRSEAIARSLDAGDPCAAAEQARQLDQAVTRAIAANRIPPPLRPPMLRATNRLVNETERLCVPPAEEPADDQPASCEALEERKKELEERKKEVEEAFKDDKDERDRRKKAIEEERKALDEELKECKEGAVSRFRVPRGALTRSQPQGRPHAGRVGCTNSVLTRRGCIRG